MASPNWVAVPGHFWGKTVLNVACAKNWPLGGNRGGTGWVALRRMAGSPRVPGPSAPTVPSVGPLVQRAPGRGGHRHGAAGVLRPLTASRTRQCPALPVCGVPSPEAFRKACGRWGGGSTLLVGRGGGESDGLPTPPPFPAFQRRRLFFRLRVRFAFGTPVVYNALWWVGGFSHSPPPPGFLLALRWTTPPPPSVRRFPWPHQAFRRSPASPNAPPPAATSAKVCHSLLGGRGSRKSLRFVPGVCRTPALFQADQLCPIIPKVFWCG